VFSRLHTSAKAEDIAKLLPLNKCYVTHILPRGIRQYLHPTTNLTLS